MIYWFNKRFFLNTERKTHPSARVKKDRFFLFSPLLGRGQKPLFQGLRACFSEWIPAPSHATPFS